ncbi:MAG: S-layer protein [uncultured bacterium]|nr:MAG: S-layer protein [uncultured bacterium]OGJ48452.1 MAG: hypothetical protein A2244_05515 [Candidatus Peregrinibacteria bacterium RIFOXYA2_FULL_41_18]OGJ53128.1 MAG: hypothetical protein A2448_00135 [Candidatus Peregrinibacteria bacterium RIFOXYC2_FULL_41_22]
MNTKIIIPAAITTIVAGLIITAVITFTTTATQPPVVDTPPSPVDAEKITLTGTAEPNAQIIVTGGPYELSPTYADETGAWSKTVALGQESTNLYSVVAVGADGDQSSSVTVEIVEGVEVAAEYEASSGISHSAPETPTVNEITSPVDSDIMTITGTAETDATVIVTGSDTGETDVLYDGTFAIEVELEQNAVNTFYVSAANEFNMMSSSVKVTIEEISENVTELEEDQTHDAAEEEEEELEEISFSDTTGHWAEDYIIDLAEQGTVGGYSDGTFGPNNYITRAEITKIALGAFEYEIGSHENKFSDVESDAWYEDYITSAYDEDIVGGYTDGTFKPGNYINRAEALKILLKGSKIEDLDGSEKFLGTESDWNNSFTDVSESDWFYEYVMKAYTGGIVSGYSSTLFAPGNNITRAETCKIVINLLNLIEEIKATPTI